MLIRVFRTTVKSEKQAQFEQILIHESFPFMRSQPGLITLHIGRPLPQNPNEYMIVSIWEDLEALKAFTGDNWLLPVILESEVDIVTNVELAHHEVIEGLAYLVP